MVYRDSFKTWLIRGICFGVWMGICGIIVARSVAFGLTSGLLSGVLFAITVYKITSNFEKKSGYLRDEISKVRKIVCEGPADYKKGSISSGGWLFLSEDALEYYPVKRYAKVENMAVLLDDVLYIKTKQNKLIITAKSGDYIFVVCKADLWKKEIENIL